MEFHQTLLAAQRNQQQKSSESLYYKARFDPPKKELKNKDRLSANIQKFLAKKDEEEKQKKMEAQRKKEELLAMRDPKALRKIQKTLKVIKSANKSVLQDAVDRDNTAVTLTGPEQPDQDDYGYESQEAAALYAKMMQKYSKIPDEPKFPNSGHSVKKDLNGTRERVKHALQHEDEPVPHKRRRRGENNDRDTSPPTKYEPEKKKEDTKSDKPKIRKPLPPPIDFNQLLKLAEQKKSEPVEVVSKKVVQETETERPMTKKQRREYEEELARRQRRQERLDAEKNGKVKVKEDKVVEKERKPESGGFARIPKLSDRNSTTNKNDSSKLERAREADRQQKEKERIKTDKDKLEREKERLDKIKLERDRIARDIERLNKDRERLEKEKSKLEIKASDRPGHLDRSKMNVKDANSKKNIDLKSQNTYRIDKNANERKLSQTNESRYTNGHTSLKSVPKLKEQGQQKNGMKEKALPGKNRVNDERNKPVNKKLDDKKPASKPQAGASRPAVSNNFDFDKHVNSLGKNGVNKPGGSRQFPPGDVRRKRPDDMRMKQKRRAVASDSEYDSELDDFIDDGDEEMDYSKHIKEIFGYDKSKYRDMDDDDDPTMESSFARQQREEYISKKIGIMEDLEDMRMEALEKKKAKKSRRISDD